MRRAAQQFGYVRLRSNDPPCTVTARLSDTRPNVDSGYGGWTEVARPRKAPLAVWVGSTALRVSIPLLLDGWVTGQSVEPEIAQLERMATATSSDGTPPRVRFTAKGAAVPHQNRLWVIDNLAWGDALMNANGNRVRQQVTVSLLEYVADVPVQADSAATRQRAKASAAKSQSGASQKRVVAGRGRSTVPNLSQIVAQTMAVEPEPEAAAGLGDDLLSIAARELGDADRWVEIAQLNGIRDPRTIRVGQVIRLP